MTQLTRSTTSTRTAHAMTLRIIDGLRTRARGYAFRTTMGPTNPDAHVRGIVPAGTRRPR